jgi:hypothetical protein
MNEPIHIISLGAGVQSSTMALMAAKGEITPMPVAAIFADTMHEPSSVYEWLGWLEKQLPFPVITVRKGDLKEAVLRVRVSKKTGLTYMKPNIPAFMLRANGKRGRMTRHCTLDYKIVMIRRKAREYWREQYKKLRQPITMWIGISSDEVSRMKDSVVPWIINRHPFIETETSRQDCLDWMKKNNLPEPPRSACEFCPLHSDDVWIDLRANDPESFERTIQFEKELQITTAQVPRLDGIPFLHDSLKPLNQVEFKPGKNLDAFNNECEGMCGV